MNQERVSPRKLPGRARSQCVTHPGSKPTAFGPLDRYCHRKLYSKKLLVLIWPIFIEMLLQILVGNVDQLMIAGYQQEAVGAIANANQVLSTLLMVFSMISMAESILISQYRGAGDLQQLERVYTLSCVLNVLLSLVVSVALFCADDVLLRLLRVPEIFLEPARQYIQIVGGGSILQALFLTFSAIFRSNQHMKTSMLVSILMNGINIAGNALLIYGAGPIPAMGVRGVAIATNLSRLAGLSALMFLFWRRKIGRINLSCLRPFPTGLLKKLVCIGIPAGGEVLSYNLSQLVVLSFVNGFGPDSTTARAYCSMISNVALLYCLSAAQATQIIVGYQVGGGQYDAAQQTTRLAVISSVVITTAASLGACLLVKPILAMVHAVPGVVTLCTAVMQLEVVRQFGRSFNMLLIRALQGAGDIRCTILVGIVSMWVTVVGLGYVFGCLMGWGLCGIWAAMALDENLRGLIFVRRWRSGVWKQKTLISQ